MKNRFNRVGILFALVIFAVISFSNVENVYAAPDDARLSDIALDGVSIDGFSPDVFEYSVDVDWLKESIAIAATAVEPLAAVSGDIGLRSLAAGSNDFTITVVSEDTTGNRDYILHIIRETDTTPIVHFDCPNLKQALLSFGLDYNLDNELSEKEMLYFGPTLHLIDEGITDLTGLEYAVNVNDLHITNSNINTLETDTFDMMTNLMYLFIIDSGVTNLESGCFNGLTNLSSLTLSGNRISNLSTGVFDSLTSLDYLSLQWNHLTGIESDVFTGIPNLSNLNISCNFLDINTTSDDYSEITQISGLSFLIYEPQMVYEAVLESNGGTCSPLGDSLYYHNESFTLPTAEKEGYAFLGWDADGDRTADISGGAQTSIAPMPPCSSNLTGTDAANPVQTVTYSAIYDGDEATLVDLAVDGQTIDGFSSCVFTYDIIVEYSIDAIDISAESLYTEATVSGDTGVQNLAVGANAFTITCTAQGGATTEDYTINVTRIEPLSDAALSDLTIDGQTSDGFSDDIYTYDFTVGFAVDHVDIGAASDANGQITGDIGVQALYAGLNTFTITCTAEDSITVQNYVLNITRPASSANGFTNLGFVTMDTALDPDRMVVYTTTENGYSLYRVDLNTGGITYLTFQYAAERLTVKNGKVYLTLLHRPHDRYLDNDGSGTIAVMDTATFTLINTFDVVPDPFDIEADDNGIVYITPGSGQRSIGATYNSITGEQIEVQSMSERGLWELNEQYNKLYCTEYTSSINRMNVYEVSGGTITNVYSADLDVDGYQTQYFKISPDDQYVFL